MSATDKTAGERIASLIVVCRLAGVPPMTERKTPEEIAAKIKTQWENQEDDGNEYMPLQKSVAAALRAERAEADELRRKLDAAEASLRKAVEVLKEFANENFTHTAEDFGYLDSCEKELDHIQELASKTLKELGHDL